MQAVGVIGWGRMGGAMGLRLVTAGHEVHAFDVEQSARWAAQSAGAAVLDSAREVAARCDAFITMLPAATDVEAAAFSPDGVLEGIRPGGLWLEMTSSNPDVTGRLAQLAGERRATLLDCPVSGGVRGAREGRLTVIVGGPSEALDRARPLLETLGDRIVRVGDRPGEGDLAKTINNMLSAINLAAAAEGLALAKAGGLAIEPLLDVLNGSSGASNATRVKIPDYVLTGRFDAGFTIAQYVKDLDVALDFARARDLPSKLLSEAQIIWSGAVARGHGDDDHTAIVPHVSARLGVPWGSDA
jgi:3-hydroxyisobutyrate dehydrogenase-like beta-hydroxyacid dehydrogenase